MFQNIEHEISNLRVAILQMLCVENLYAQEARYEGRKFDTLMEKNL